MIQGRRVDFFSRISFHQELPSDCFFAHGQGAANQFVLGNSEGYVGKWRNEGKHVWGLRVFKHDLINLVTTENYVFAIGRDALSDLKWKYRVMDFDFVVIASGTVCPVQDGQTAGSCLTVSTDHSYLGLSFRNSSSVYLIGGDLLLPDTYGMRYVQSKTLSGTSLVVGLTFVTVDGRLFLFVARTNSVQTFEARPYSHGQAAFDQFNQTLEEDLGEPPLHVCSYRDQLVILNSAGIFTFSPTEGNLQGLSLSGEKYKMCSARDYLVLVFQMDDQVDKETVVILWTRGKRRLVAHAFECRQVTEVCFTFDSKYTFYIFTANGQIFQLDEIHVDEQIEKLERKRLYEFAAEIAESRDPKRRLQDMYRRHGHFLMSKWKTEQAVQIYCQTISYLRDPISPSEAILLFLKNNDLRSLEEYLYLYIVQGYGITREHIFFLINILVYIGDDKKLNDLIGCGRIQWNVLKESLNRAECEEVLTLLINHNNESLARALAKRMGMLDEWISLCIKGDKLGEALEVLKKMSLKDAEHVLSGSGGALFHFAPQQFIEILQPMLVYHLEKDNTSRFVADVCQKIFLNDPLDLLTLFSGFLEGQPPCFKYEHLFLTFADIFLPRRMDYETEFRLTKEKQLFSLLQDYFPVISSKSRLKLLIICQNSDYEPGQIFLLEKLEKFTDLLDYYEGEGNAQAVVDVLRKFGARDEHLWSQALHYLSKSADNPCLFMEVLLEAKFRGKVSSIMACEILQKSSIPLCHLREFFKRAEEELEEGNDEAHKDALLDQDQCLRTESELNRLLSEHMEFGMNDSCDFCHLRLDLPVLNFWCGHSFHNYCVLNSGTKSCPVCQDDATLLQADLNYLENPGRVEDEFFKYLDGATDGFQYICERIRSFDS